MKKSYFYQLLNVHEVRLKNVLMKHLAPVPNFF
jgi:hypothetical protein